MNLLGSSDNHNQHQKHHPQKRNKKKLTEDQVSLLEYSFSANKKLEPERKQQLARQLGIPPRQIAIWYQNKRTRWKNQSLELDYSSLQLRLETTLAEKRQLQKEVEWLQAELNKVQAGQAQYPLQVSSQLSSCNCDEVGNSSLSLQEDVNCCSWDVNKDQVLQVEELYACLMGTDHALFGYKKSLF